MNTQALVIAWATLVFFALIALELLLYEFCYYWLHRAGHGVNILWATHEVRRQCGGAWMVRRVCRQDCVKSRGRLIYMDV
ncbi:MAG TPA: hypothetical protein VMV99_02925 [Rhodanobacter sp.]|nr:hypothetical protein [Rhodanobacter sp.]